MSHKEFCYWLQGFVELTDWVSPNQYQWQTICNELNKTFENENVTVHMDSEKSSDE
jgi:hypothetical protein